MLDVTFEVCPVGVRGMVMGGVNTEFTIMSLICSRLGIDSLFILFGGGKLKIGRASCQQVFFTGVLYIVSLLAKVLMNISDKRLCPRTILSL